MSMNIKSERVHALAREAARVTGKSQTGAVEEALEKLLREYDADPAQAARDAKAKRLLEIGARVKAAHPELKGDESLRWQDELYDPETGAPR